MYNKGMPREIYGELKNFPQHSFLSIFRGQFIHITPNRRPIREKYGVFLWVSKSVLYSVFVFIVLLRISHCKEQQNESGRRNQWQTFDLITIPSNPINQCSLLKKKAVHKTEISIQNRIYIYISIFGSKRLDNLGFRTNRSRLDPTADPGIQSAHKMSKQQLLLGKCHPRGC